MRHKNNVMSKKQITITGTRDSDKLKIQKALKLLERKSPEHFAYVTRYLDCIHADPDKPSRVDCSTRTFIIGKRTLKETRWWIAAALVHEAKHVEFSQPGKKRVTQDIEEKECLEAMFEAGRKIFLLWRFFYGEPKTLYQTKWWKTKPKDQDW